MSFMQWCTRFIHVGQQPISFKDRPYLDAIYASPRQQIVIRASRQVEKTTFLVNTIIYLSIQHPGVQILFVCPRQEQARVFSNARLAPTLLQSPLVARQLLGRRRRQPAVTDLRFVNGSAVYIRSAYHDADAVRGISADVLLIDEFQDIAPGMLPVLKEALSHSRHQNVILTGTPKTVDNHLESCFRESTAHEFQIPCPCGADVLLDERCLGPRGIVCPACQHPLDAKTGRWMARNPTSRWGDGFWLNHLMVPWVDYQHLLENQRTYDPALFRNECLGLPTTLGDHIVSRQELEACCGQEPMAAVRSAVPPAYQNALVAGIDWGGGVASRTALTLGYMDDQYRFVVVLFEVFAAAEDPSVIVRTLAERCRAFGVCAIAADGGGNGTVYNRLLYDQLQTTLPFYTILYSVTDSAPQQDGALLRWTVGRSPSIGYVFARVKKRSMVFPRVTECGSFLDEICCETAEYDAHNRTVKYIHPEGQPDDCLHATNYAVLVGCLQHKGRTMYGE